MRRQNRILIAEILGALAALFLGIVLFMAASALLDGTAALSDQVTTVTSQAEVDDVEGYGVLVDLAGLALGNVGALALFALAFLEMMLAAPALLFAIIARVSHRPGRRGRYVVLTILALAPLVLVAIVALVLGTGGTLSVLWIVSCVFEAVVIAYSIVETSRLLKDDREAGGDDANGRFGGDFVPAPEDAR